MKNNFKVIDVTTIREEISETYNESNQKKLSLVASEPCAASYEEAE